MSSIQNFVTDDNSTAHYELTGNGATTNRPDDAENRVAEINQKLEQVKQITIDNIEKVIDRGERIDMLVEGTERLQNSSNHFYRQSKNIAREMRYRKYRCYAILLLLSGLAIYVLAWMICGNGTLRHCG